VHGILATNPILSALKMNAGDTTARISYTSLHVPYISEVKRPFAVLAADHL
jgi:hypothetical protein